MDMRKPKQLSTNSFLPSPLRAMFHWRRRWGNIAALVTRDRCHRYIPVTMRAMRDLGESGRDSDRLNLFPTTSESWWYTKLRPIGIGLFQPTIEYHGSHPFALKTSHKYLSLNIYSSNAPKFTFFSQFSQAKRIRWDYSYYEKWWETTENREIMKPNTILVISSFHHTSCIFPLVEGLGRCRCPCH